MTVLLVSRSMTALAATVTVLNLVSIVHAEKFKCPAFTKLTEDKYLFPDPSQCDVYWECRKGNSKRNLCPDGLVFHPEKPEGEDPCDLMHNVPDRCKSRSELQRPKPGDAHCPRQNGVYPSDDPFECDIFYSCLNGKSSSTKCAEGLHFSEDIGTCVWARESGRTGCASAEEKRAQKKKPAADKKDGKPKEKPKSLPNGFRCPGGALGVHPALPHPTSCRQYYICLDGITPTEAGCTKGRVFNKYSQQCDLPKNVPGCEDFYDEKARAQKENIAESLGTELNNQEFSKFISLLKMSGVLGDAAPLGPRRDPPGKRPGRLGLGNRRKGGRKRPGNRRRPRPRPVYPSYDYYDDDYYDYDYEEAVEILPRRRIPGTFQDNRRKEAVIEEPVRRKEAVPVEQPRREQPRKIHVKEEDPVEEENAIIVDRPHKVGNTLFPARTKSKFIEKFRPRVRPVGDLENIHPVGLQGASTPGSAPRTPSTPPTNPVSVPESGRRGTAQDFSLSAKEADNIFNSLFRESPASVVGAADTTTPKPSVRPTEPAATTTSQHSESGSLFERRPPGRNSLFSRHRPLSGSRDRDRLESTAATSQPTEPPTQSETTVTTKSSFSRFRELAAGRGRLSFASVSHRTSESTPEIQDPSVLPTVTTAASTVSEPVTESIATTSAVTARTVGRTPFATARTIAVTARTPVVTARTVTANSRAPVAITRTATATTRAPAAIARTATATTRAPVATARTASTFSRRPFFSRSKLRSNVRSSTSSPQSSASTEQISAKTSPPSPTPSIRSRASTGRRRPTVFRPRPVKQERARTEVTVSPTAATEAVSTTEEAEPPRFSRKNMFARRPALVTEPPRTTADVEVAEDPMEKLFHQAQPSSEVTRSFAPTPLTTTVAEESSQFKEDEPRILNLLEAVPRVTMPVSQTTESSLRQVEVNPPELPAVPRPRLAVTPLAAPSGPVGLPTSFTIRPRLAVPASPSQDSAQFPVLPAAPERDEVVLPSLVVADAISPRIPETPSTFRSRSRSRSRSRKSQRPEAPRQLVSEVAPVPVQRQPDTTSVRGRSRGQVRNLSRGHTVPLIEEAQPSVPRGRVQTAPTIPDSSLIVQTPFQAAFQSLPIAKPVDPSSLLSKIPPVTTEDNEARRMVAERLKTRLSAVLPEAENKGHAIELLREKVNSSKNLNRARG